MTNKHEQLSYLFILLSGAYFVGNQIMRSMNKYKLPASVIIGKGVYSSIIGFGLLE